MTVFCHHIAAFAGCDYSSEFFVEAISRLQLIKLSIFFRLILPCFFRLPTPFSGYFCRFSWLFCYFCCFFLFYYQFSAISSVFLFFTSFMLLFPSNWIISERIGCSSSFMHLFKLICSRKKNHLLQTCFKSIVIVMYSFSGPTFSVGLCHHFCVPSITYSIGCMRSVSCASQTPHFAFRCRCGCASIVWQYSSRVCWPHVAFACSIAFGATLKTGGHNPTSFTPSSISSLLSASDIKPMSAKPWNSVRNKE